MKLALFVAAAALCATAAPAMAVTIYTDQSAFLAATSGVAAYTLPHMGEDIAAGPTYTDGPVTFAADHLIFYESGYGTPYISDVGLAADDTFTITTSGGALGLLLGSYPGPHTYNFTVNGVSGSIALPGPFVGTQFLGFTDSGAISVSFAVPRGDEVDVPKFYAGAAGVPEPATWAMMLLGVGALGAAMRVARRRERSMAATA